MLARSKGLWSVSVKLISVGRINDAAAKYGEHAPMAATCCNACRTCVQTNAIAAGLAAVIAVRSVVPRLARRLLNRATA